MIVDWIYNHPTGLWGSILVCGTTVLACLGLALASPSSCRCEGAPGA